MQTYLAVEDLKDLSESLPLLEAFSFDGEDLKDDALLTLATFPRLRTANITATSAITFDGILKFITCLETGDEYRHGFGLYVMNQLGNEKFSPDEEEILNQQMIAAVG